MDDRKVKFFKALGDETRIRIVRCLLRNEMCACKFGSATGKDQTTVSRHLRILVEAGVLKYHKQGRNIIYSIRNLKVKNALLNFGISALSSCC